MDNQTIQKVHNKSCSSLSSPMMVIILISLILAIFFGVNLYKYYYDTVATETWIWIVNGIGLLFALGLMVVGLYCMWKPTYVTETTEKASSASCGKNSMKGNKRIVEY